MGRSLAQHHPAIAIGALILVAGCAYVNKPLNKLDTPIESRAVNQARAAIGRVPATMPSRPGADDGYFIGVALGV